MRNEFTAIVERDGDWFVAYCPEIHGANSLKIVRSKNAERICGGDCSDSR